MTKLIRVLFFFCLTFTLVFSLKASEINITADKMEVFESEGVVVFTGKVFGVKEDLKVWCDKMYVYYTPTPQQKKKINKIVALGKVVIEKGKWKAYAGKAVYFKNEEKLILEETPKVWHEKNLVEGDIVILYFNEDRSEILAKDQGRVRAQVYF